MQNAQKTGSGNLYSRTCKFLHFTAKTVTRLVCKTHYLEVAGILQEIFFFVSIRLATDTETNQIRYSLSGHLPRIAEYQRISCVRLGRKESPIAPNQRKQCLGHQIVVSDHQRWNFQYN